MPESFTGHLSVTGSGQWYCSEFKSSSICLHLRKSTRVQISTERDTAWVEKCRRCRNVRNVYWFLLFKNKNPLFWPRPPLTQRENGLTRLNTVSTMSRFVTSPASMRPSSTANFIRMPLMGTVGVMPPPPGGDFSSAIAGETPVPLQGDSGLNKHLRLNSAFRREALKVGLHQVLLDFWGRGKKPGGITGEITGDIRELTRRRSSTYKEVYNEESYNLVLKSASNKQHE